MKRPEPGDVFRVLDPRRRNTFVVQSVRDRGMSSETLTVANIGVGGDHGWVGDDGVSRAMIGPFRDFKIERLRRCEWVETWENRREKVPVDADEVAERQSEFRHDVGTSDRANCPEQTAEELAAPLPPEAAVKRPISPENYESGVMQEPPARENGVRDPSVGVVPRAGDVYEHPNHPKPDYYRVITPTADRKSCRVVKCDERGVPLFGSGDPCVGTPEAVIANTTLAALKYLGNTRLGNIGLGIPIAPGSN